MTRVKRGTIANKRRKNVLAQVKGYRFGRSTKERMAKDAIAHAGTYAFAHRRDKKSDKRRIWQVQINAAESQYRSRSQDSVRHRLLKTCNIQTNF
jgi:large subunit ribosomal protein L20